MTKKINKTILFGALFGLILGIIALTEGFLPSKIANFFFLLKIIPFIILVLTKVLLDDLLQERSFIFLLYSIYILFTLLFYTLIGFTFAYFVTLLNKGKNVKQKREWKIFWLLFIVLLVIIVMFLLFAQFIPRNIT